MLLQQRSVDRLRGRVFGSEWLFVLFMESVSILCASIVLEMAWLNLQQAFICFALVQVICGALWLFIIVPAEKKDIPDALYYFLIVKKNKDVHLKRAFGLVFDYS